jgi:hypothetical protein
MRSVVRDQQQASACLDPTRQRLDFSTVEGRDAAGAVARTASATLRAPWSGMPASTMQADQPPRPAARTPSAAEPAATA